MRCSSPWRLGSIARPCTGIGKSQRREVDVVVLGGVVQHGVEVDLVDLGDRARCRPAARCAHLDVVLALQHEQVADLERLAAVADVELAVARDRALVHAEDAQLADERVDRDLEHVRQHVLRRVGRGRASARRRRPRRRRKSGGLASVGFGQQLDDHVEQLGHAGAGARRDEAHRDQVAFAQRLLERRVQLGRRRRRLLRGSGRRSRRRPRPPARPARGAPRRRGRSRTVPVAVEEAVDHLRAAARRAGSAAGIRLPKAAWICASTPGRSTPCGVDLVDDDHAVELARGRVLHHAHRHRLDAGRRR